VVDYIRLAKSEANVYIFFALLTVDVTVKR
jgi:hypothetical protein